MKLRSITAMFCIAILLTCAGCGQPGAPTTNPGVTITDPNKPLILAAIGAAAEIGTHQGLRALAKNNLAAANETATALRKNIDTTLLPYLDGGKITTEAEIQVLLNSSLFAGVDPSIRNAIAAAAAVLDAYRAAPGASTILQQDQIDYIKAFLNGISKGCVDYQPGRIPRGMKSRWIEIE